MKQHRVVCTFTILVAVQASKLLGDSVPYSQANLVSDLSTVGAQTVDPNLVNPWGMSFSTTSPTWISNAGSNNSTAYSGTGAATTINVTVSGNPTGQVFNSAGTGNFLVNGSASNFIFSTLSGSISAWTGSIGVTGTAIPQVTTAGAAYTGLAIGNNGSANYLYAANFTSGGGINVFNSSFGQVNSTTFADKFVAPIGVPSNYAPFNVQQVGNALYVEYAEVGSTPGNANRGAGLGYVGVFDLNGNFLRSFTNSNLNAPWGVTLAPAGFGQFGNDLLVGNFGNGTINAFDPNTGAYLGTLDNASGTPIVNQDLWALDFRTNGGDNSNPDALYFTAGINGQKDGLFGEITPAPEPATYGLSLLSAGALFAMVRLSRRKGQANSRS